MEILNFGVALLVDPFLFGLLVLKSHKVDDNVIIHRVALYVDRDF